MAKSESRSPEQLYKEYTSKYPTIQTKTVPTGSIALDYVFGGGLPLGRVILFTSAPGLGKTLVSLCLSGAVLADSTDDVVLYIDPELGVDKELVRAVHGEDFGERFVHVSPPHYEGAQEVIENYCKTGKLAAVFVDSVTALQPKDVIEGDKNPIGAKASAESMFCLRMKIFASTYKFGVVYVNQQRAYISMTGGGRNTPSTKGAGGWALKYYNDISINMRPVQYIYSKAGNKVGSMANITCEKNRIVGNVSAYIHLKYGQGISNLATVIEALKYHNLIKQSGAYFEVCIEGMKTDSKLRGNLAVEEWAAENYEQLCSYLGKGSLMKDFFEEWTGK